MINRKYCIDSKIDKLECIERDLFIRLIIHTNDHGKYTGDLFELQYKLIPTFNIDFVKSQLPNSSYKNKINSVQDFLRYALHKLDSVGLIRYTDEVIVVRGFYKNQKIGHRPAKDIYPDVNGITQPLIRKNFKKPTLKELEAYILEKKYKDIDAQAFLDYYETNGWVQGSARKPIKDWKACVRTWNRKGDKKNVHKMQYKTS